MNPSDPRRRDSRPSALPTTQLHPDAHDETRAVADRYARRARTLDARLYSMLSPDVWQTVQERQRAILKLFKRLGWPDLRGLKLIEVGCGSGVNLLEFLRIGFAPQNLSGVELLPDRLAMARRVLPKTLQLHGGDACLLDLPAGSQDVVFQATVFSSLLDTDFRIRLADQMWRWVKPGGGVLWYDFTVNNPKNPDVRGVPLRHVQRLFPQGKLNVTRVTLAPPLARKICRLSPSLYPVFNAVPQLRTHALVWIEKPLS